MEDLFGMGKGSEKLVDVIANAVGAIYRPYGIRREADAEAYKIRLLERAKSEQKAEEIRILAEAKRDEILIIDSSSSTLEERAQARKKFNDLRRQKNLESVIIGAFKHIGNDVSQETVDPDWLQTLIGYAEEANSEQMQDLWSRVLAGETELPGAFSLRSLKTLKEMSRTEAEIFTIACHLSSRYDNTNPQIMLITGFRCGEKDTSIDLRDYGCGLLNIMALCELGLLYKDEIIRQSSKDDSFPMIVAGNSVIMTSKEDKSGFACYNFTHIGRELARLVATRSHDAYFKSFAEAAELAFEIKSDATEGIS